MGPYRTPSEPEAPRAQAAPLEELVLAIALVVIGLARVVPALLAHEAFGAETTIALAMVAVGARNALHTCDIAVRAASARHEQDDRAVDTAIRLHE